MMSAVENGLPSSSDSITEIKKMKDKKSAFHPPTSGRDFKSKGCNGERNTKQQNSTDQDCDDLDVSSPEISLSSQTTLRYSDVEPEHKEHDTSQESSDSIETLEEHPNQDAHTEINQTFLQQLTLTHNASVSSMDSVDRLDPPLKNRGSSFSDDNTSGDSHEVIPEFSNMPRPESLSLPRPLQAIEREQKKNSDKMKRLKDNDNCEFDSVGAKTSPSTSLPTNIEDKGAHYMESNSSLSQSLPQGTITRKGDLIQFVADDLQEKIKQSSPLSHADGASSGSRRSSVRSIASASSSTSFATSSGVSRSPSSLFQQSPDDIPPIDASAVIELENHARRVADSLDLMMGNIRNNLHKMSAITIGCQDAYKRSVDITCDSVDASIKSMYALMAKCEELSAAMKPVDQLGAQIKEIKRILDLFEAQLDK